MSTQQCVCQTQIELLKCDIEARRRSTGIDLLRQKRTCMSVFIKLVVGKEVKLTTV